MFPKIINAYRRHGYSIDLGNPSIIAARLLKDGCELHTGGGLPVTDIALFTAIAKAKPDLLSWFLIGNAFGFSTFLLAELFPNAIIDVIDAETEGENNRAGSVLTREISAVDFPNVRLTTGFSPQDVRKAARLDSYSAAFIDGLHTNDQMIADFRGLLPLLAPASIVVFHDVGVCLMDQGWAECKALGTREGFRAYELPWTLSGCTVFVRNIPALSELFDNIGGELRNSKWKYYEIGRPYTNKRPKLFHKTLYELELGLKYRIKRLFGRA